MARRRRAHWFANDVGHRRVRLTTPDLVAAYKGWAGQIPFTVQLTLTFRFPTSKARAEAEATDFCAVLEWAFRRHQGLTWLYGLEKHVIEGWHVHLLVTDVNELSMQPLLGVWRLAHGNTDIKVLDNPVDGVGYVTKNGAFAEISFSGRRFRDVTYPSAGHTGHTRSGPRIEGFV